MTAIAERPVFTIRPYSPDDYRLISRWRAMRGEDGDIYLPPLGVVVMDVEGPCAALWCAEPAGFGCAYLEYPISRPGLLLIESVAAFGLAVKSLIALAGKCHEPPGEYKDFRAVTSTPLARILLRMGFVRECQQELVPMIYRREG